MKRATHVFAALMVVALAFAPVQGGEETVVYKTVDGRALKLLMKSAGTRCDAHIYPKAGHGFFNREPYLSLTLIETDKFLASLGWLKGLPLRQTPAQAPSPR